MTIFGNTALLDQPSHGFICSRHTMSSVILPCLDWAVNYAHGNEPVMSTFHSEMESAVLDMLLPGRCPIIMVLGRKPYKVLPQKLQAAMEAGRLLVISLSNEVRNNRKLSQRCNDFICNTAADLTFGFLSPNSSLNQLHQKAMLCHKPITILTQL